MTSAVFPGSAPLPPTRTPRRPGTVARVAIVAAALCLAVTWKRGVWTIHRCTLVIEHVPWPVIQTAVTHRAVWQAYLDHDLHRLHATLQALDTEERIKAFYRPDIPDEVRLDQYIHQVFYDLSGYVGDSYRVNDAGVLVLRVPPG